MVVKIMTEKDITLTSDKINLSISPQYGACITSFTYKKNGGDFNVLRPTNINELKEKGATASSGFAILPYVGEIKEGNFIYWGIKRKVSDNPEEAVNGDSWKKSWQMDGFSSTKLKMSYKHEGNNGFPYPYTARQVIELSENKVKITLTVINNFELPMPLGMGFFPFFPKTPDVELKCRNYNVWSHEGLMSLSKPYRTPEEWRYEKLSSFGKTELDTYFGGFDGNIELKYKKNKIAVELKSEGEFHNVYIKNKLDEDFFNICPATNTQDAFNIAARGVIGSGIMTLEPNESCSQILEFTITDL